jgi:hypothetical protein
MKTKTQCNNQVRAMLVNGPGDLREQMRPLTTGRLIQALSWLRSLLYDRTLLSQLGPDT